MTTDQDLLNGPRVRVRMAAPATAPPHGEGLPRPLMTAAEVIAWSRRAHRHAMAVGDPSPPMVTIGPAGAEGPSGCIDVWWCDGRILASVSGEVADWSPVPACRHSDGWPTINTIREETR